MDPQMTGWIYTIFTFFVYLIQTTILCKFTVFGVMPDAVLVCVICYSMVFGRERGFVAALLTGILMDFLSGGAFGKNMATYLLSAALASILAENTFGKNFLTAALITLAVSLAGGTVMSLYLFLTKLDINIVFTMFVGAPVYAVYNMIFGAGIFIFMENLRKISYRRE